MSNYVNENNKSSGNKKIIIAVTVALVAGFGIGAGAYFISQRTNNNDAQILAVNPAYQTTREAYNSCDKVATSYTTKNQKNGETGTLVGSTAGGAALGAAGAAIGSNNGGTGGAAVGGALGGAAGALGGGLLGGKIQKSNQPTYVTHKGYKTQCKILYRPVQTQIGYATQYLYNNSVGSIITQNPLTPGIKIPFNILQTLAVNNATSATPQQVIK